MLREMTSEEVAEWQAYFQVKDARIKEAEAVQEAAAEAKKKAKEVRQ